MGEGKSGDFLKWDARFLEIAHVISTWSKDKSTKVGCVIVDAGNRIIATGYNGLPRRLDDDPEEFPERHDRERQKYAFYEHGERNALYQAAALGTAVAGCTMYITMSPCADCARGIIQSGISRVVFDLDKTEAYKGKLDLSTPTGMLSEAYVELIGLRNFQGSLKKP